jgi:hypothetical protein
MFSRGVGGVLQGFVIFRDPWTGLGCKNQHAKPCMVYTVENTGEFSETPLINTYEHYCHIIVPVNTHIM